jgi:predicted TIM-barrel fold metal-dependent hydrolase
MAAQRIIDFHARLAPRPHALETMLSAMDAAGIEHTAVCSGGVVDIDTLATHILTGGWVESDADNYAVLRACARSDGRLIPVFFGNPHTGAGEYRRCATEFRGLELSPSIHGISLTDERNVAFVEIAEQVGHSVYVVCIGRAGCDTAELVALARRFPEVRFVLGHCGFIGIDFHALNLIRDVPNISAELSGCYWGVAKAAVQRLGADRVLFGSEYPLQHLDVELTKLRALELDGDQFRRITRTNAERLFSEVRT